MITHANTSGASREMSEQECDVLPSCAYTLPPKDGSDSADEGDGDDDETEDDDDDDKVDDGGCDVDDDDVDDDDVGDDDFDDFDVDVDDVDEAFLCCKAVRALGAWYVQPSGRQPMSTS